MKAGAKLLLQPCAYFFGKRNDEAEGGPKEGRNHFVGRRTGTSISARSFAQGERHSEAVTKKELNLLAGILVRAGPMVLKALGDDHLARGLKQGSFHQGPFF